jgi:4-amino-4-deoxy-L-arabinose transferase-like glycosyltransferase
MEIHALQAFRNPSSLNQTNTYRLPSYLLLLPVLAFVAFLQFYHLGELAIVQWDESRLAVNAAEMYHSGNFLITTYEDLPDLYNTKPPLMIWLQVTSIYLFGLNEWAIRFPSALSGFLTILLSGLIVYRHRNNIYQSCLAMVLLACSNGLIQLHGSLTGDYDSLLTLFLLSSFYHFYYGFIDGNALRHKLYFLLFLSLAILCKSAAAFVVFPIFILTLLPKKNHKPILQAFLLCGLSVLPFALYCFLRETASEGYWQAMMENDFGGRFSKALEGHSSEWYYYIVNLFDYRFHYFIWILPLALVLAWLKKDRAYRYYSAVAFCFLVLISIPQTRIHWYDMPVLPVIAIVITMTISIGYDHLPQAYLKIIYICLLSLLMLPLIADKYQFIASRKGLVLDRGHYELSDLLRKKKDRDSLIYIARHYDAEFYFYTKTNNNVHRGYFSSLKPGEIVAMGNFYKDSLKNHYHYTLLDSTQNAQKIRITGIK